MDEKDKPIPHNYEFFSDLLYIYKNYNIVTPDMEKQLSNLKKNYNIEELDNQSAKIKIKFFGKIRALQERFKENGFQFQILNNQWYLNLSN